MKMIRLSVLIIGLGTTCFLLIAGDAMSQKSTTAEQPPTWASFEMDQLKKQRAEKNQSYLSFLNRSTLTCGVYHLAAGSKDHQSPHKQDEVYYVESGRGKFHVDGKEMDVQPGTILFVQAGVKHYFHSIQEDLTLLVFFSTAPVSQ